MLLAEPTRTIHDWVLGRLRSVVGSRARLVIVSEDWVDEVAESGRKSDLDWGLVTRTALSSVDSLQTHRVVLGFSLIGLWSGSHRNLEWTDRQVRQVYGIQRALLTECWPEGVDFVTSGQATSTDITGLVAWEIPFDVTCAAEG